MVGYTKEGASDPRKPDPTPLPLWLLFLGITTQPCQSKCKVPLPGSCSGSCGWVCILLQDWQKRPLVKPALLVPGGHSAVLSLLTYLLAENARPAHSLRDTALTRELGCCSRAPGPGSGRFPPTQPGSIHLTPQPAVLPSASTDPSGRGSLPQAARGVFLFWLVVCVTVLEDWVPSSLNWQVCRVCPAGKWHLSNGLLWMGNHIRMLLWKH